MQRLLLLVPLVVVTLAVLAGCPDPPPAEGEGEEGEGEEGEGEGEEGEGEGEGEEGEGEGEGEGETTQCSSDAACSGADVCLFSDRDNDDFILDGEGACGALPAGDDVGEGCVAGQAECARGLCLGNLCSALCTVDGDCPLGMRCDSRGFTLDDGTGGQATVCVANGQLPAVDCLHDADCADTGRVCNHFTQDFQLQCGFPGGGAAFTESCSSTQFENRTVCETGLCDGEANAGMCTRTCTSNPDCGQGTLCSTSPFTNVEGFYCAEPCVQDADCNLAAGRFCTVRDDIAGVGLDTVCAPPLGDKGFAQDAAGGLDCQTGLVIDGKCTKLCQGDGSCGGGLPNCRAVDFGRLDGQGSEQISVCTAQ